MRLFVAIDLSEQMKDELLYLQGLIRSYSEKPSLASKQNLHLTLAFIGESDEKDKIINALSEIKFAPFEIKLAGIGTFSRGKEKLIYARLENNPQLNELRKNVAKALKDAGIKFDDKKFLPHITISRRTVFNFGKDETSIKSQNVTSHVNDFVLYCSDLSGKRPVYTKVYVNNGK